LLERRAAEVSSVTLITRGLPGDFVAAMTGRQPPAIAERIVRMQVVRDKSARSSLPRAE
jgi:hypothetical protein